MCQVGARQLGRHQPRARAGVERAVEVDAAAEDVRPLERQRLPNMEEAGRPARAGAVARGRVCGVEKAVCGAGRRCLAQAEDRAPLRGDHGRERRVGAEAAGARLKV